MQRRRTDILHDDIATFVYGLNLIPELSDSCCISELIFPKSFTFMPLADPPVAEKGSEN